MVLDGPLGDTGSEDNRFVSNRFPESRQQYKSL